MFTLSDIRAEFDRLDAISGLNTKDIPIRISKRMSRALGVCRSRSRADGKGFEIVDVAFADYLCRYGTEEELINTVRHEYAHLYNIVHDGVRCGHDARWKHTARWLGAKPERIARYDDLLARAKADGGLPQRKARGKRHVTREELREPLFRQLCAFAEQGIPGSELMLGEILIKGGLGRKPDPEAGWEWVARAAAHGEPRAVEMLKKRGECI